MPRPTKCGNGPAGGPGVPPLRKSRAIPGGHPHPPPSGAPVPTPFGLRPFPPPRQGESAPWKGEGLRTTARVAPTALREPCLKSGGRVRTPAPTANLEASLLFVGAGHWPARRCTRRVQEAAPYSPAPAATCSAKPGAGVEPHQPQFST